MKQEYISYENFRANVIKTLRSGFYIYGDRIIAKYYGTPNITMNAPKPTGEYMIDYNEPDVNAFATGETTSCGHGKKSDTYENVREEIKNFLKHPAKADHELMFRYLYENNKNFPGSSIVEWNQL